MYLNWQLCTWIGIFAGQALPNPAGWGLDFALIVTFIGMVAPGLRSRPVAASVVAAGAAAILLAGLPNRLGLIAAVGVAPACWPNRWKKCSPSASAVNRAMMTQQDEPNTVSNS